MILSVQDISFAYSDSTPVLKNISFDLKENQLSCIVGKSGIGKSTLFSLILGQLAPSKGEIYLQDKLVSNKKILVPIEKRNIGLLFQDVYLFPHLNVAKNISFGIKKKTKQEKKILVEEILSLLKLKGYEEKFPHELSGGQQQRIGLGRALAPKPNLLLLDEPFANLDEELSNTLCLEIKDICKKNNTSALMITHHLKEAKCFADAIGYLTQDEFTWK